MSLVGRSKDINYVVARTFHALVAPLVGWRFTVEGQEHLDNNKPAVVLGNHQTMIDILCASAPSFCPVRPLGRARAGRPPTAARDPSADCLDLVFVQTWARCSRKGAASWPRRRSSTCPSSASG